MASQEAHPWPSTGAGAKFGTTHWSVVLRAGGSDTACREEALARLCRDYWYPLYAFVRRRGYLAPEAQDLTQDFFAQLLGKQRLNQANPARGRFRTFLLNCLDHFLANEWDKQRTVKRGGRCVIVSLEELHAEDRYQREPFHELSPEKLYDRRWALTLLEKTVQRLRQEYVTSGDAASFDALQAYLSGGEKTALYKDLAKDLGITEAAVKMRVLRLRRRFGELLRAEIAETVSGPKELEAEMRDLFAACA
jgi:RNA polymerase sigma factor (sigma-70 family)